MTDTDSRLKVLIVDDEAIIRSLIVEVIEHFNLHHSQADSVNQAIRMIDQEPFDIVFLDVRLPDGNGIEILEHIMKNRPGIVVIMIIGFPSALDATKSLKLGAFDYLIKPVEVKILMNIIPRAVKAAKIQLMGPEVWVTNAQRKKKYPGKNCLQELCHERGVGKNHECRCHRQHRADYR